MCILWLNLMFHILHYAPVWDNEKYYQQCLLQVVDSRACSGALPVQEPCLISSPACDCLWHQPMWKEQTWSSTKLLDPDVIRRDWCRIDSRPHGMPSKTLTWITSAVQILHHSLLSCVLCRYYTTWYLCQEMRDDVLVLTEVELLPGLQVMTSHHRYHDITVPRW